MSTFSLDYSEMITGGTRKERAGSALLSGCTAPPRKRSNPLLPELSAARTPPRNRLESQTLHVFQGQKFHVDLGRHGCQKPRKAAKRESVLVPRERVVGRGHEHALFGQARAAVRSLQKRAQVSRLHILGRVQLEEALLRIFEVMLRVFSGSFCISLSGEKKSCRTLLQCDVSSANPGVWKFRKSAIVSGSWGGVASEKQTTSKSKRGRCSDANQNLVLNNITLDAKNVWSWYYKSARSYEMNGGGRQRTPEHK